MAKPTTTQRKYLFDIEAQWYHHLQVERAQDSIPTVQYPRITNRVGKSPPQFSHSETGGKGRKKGTRR